MIKHLITIALSAAALTAAAGIGSGHVIRFDTPNSSAFEKPWLINDGTGASPDRDWELRSLPIGNGALGGSILGSISRERVVLNEKSLWMGGPATGPAEYWAMNRSVSPATLDTIRALLLQGKNEEADRLAGRSFSGTIAYDRSRFGCFTSLGEAYVTTGLDESSITDYRRQLDIDSALVTVSFSDKGVDYTRRYFASYPDSVMVWQFAATAPQPELTWSFATPHPVTTILPAAGGNGLTFIGQLENNGMRWALSVLARTSSGSVRADYTKGSITVSGSTDAEFIIAAATDYQMNFRPDYSDPLTYTSSRLPYDKVTERIARARGLTFSQLYTTHLDDYQSLYNRVKFTLNPSTGRPDKSTPERLADYRAGVADPGLEELYFQYGRYLLLAGSRPGSLPANLQGLWNSGLDAPWHADYHNNINLQMNYWPAASTNLIECFEPFTDYVLSCIEPGRKTAQSYYGARGWTAAISGNPFGFTAPLNSDAMYWNYNPVAGPWLATQLWDHYLFTQDLRWLADRAYPAIKESADFACDLLTPVGKYLSVSPSYSPEHGTADLGATYMNAVVRQVLTDACTAAETLGVDAGSVKQWQFTLQKLPPYRIGSHGQLQEWWNDIDDPADRHRHTNHLFGLHPGNSINPLTDSLLTEACKTTLRERGDEATGWSMGWKLNHWARLLDGNHAYILYGNLLKEGTADNLWDQHPPFQIDGNFGGTAGVAEMLLQSHNNGIIQLLPALPSAWTDGEVTGLRARGGFEVDIRFASNRLQEATVKSLAGKECRLLYDGRELSFPTVKGATYRIAPAADGRLEIIR